MSGCVLITDGEERAALAACRGLRRAGYLVSVAATGRPAAAHLSRCCSERLRLPDPREDQAFFAERLEAVVRAGDYATVLPGNDASLLAVSAYRERFEPSTRLGLPPPADVERSVDKIRLVEAAAAAGLASPRSIACADEQDARAAARAIGFPVAVKPARSFVLANGHLEQRSTSIVGNDADLARAVQDVGTPFLVQEIEPEPVVVSCGGVVADGRLRALAVSRYHRTWPPRAGNASFSETITPPDGLFERIERLVAATGWEGIFEVELFDRRGGLAAIDLNPRVYGSMTLAVHAGANLPAIWCDILLGRDAPVAIARPGIRYRWEEAELRNFVRGLRSGTPRAAAAVARPQRRVVHAFFRADDPAPVVARPISLALRKLRRRESERRGPFTVERATLDSHRAEWDELAERSGNLFSSWEWASIWWRHFGGGRPLEVTACRSEDGRCAALLPLYLWSSRGLRVARFVGHGAADELGPVCAPGDVPLAASALRSAIARHRCDVLLAERLRADDGWSRLLGGKVLRRAASPVLRVDGGWDAFLASRSHNFRGQVRGRERKLARRHDVRYRLADDRDRLQADMDVLFALHRARWGRKRSGFAAYEAFHRDFAATALERGWLRLWFLEVDGEPVAAWYGFRFAGIESYYQAGRDPAWDHASVGFVLLVHTIRAALDDGVREYRFLQGAEEYKYRFATEDPGVETIGLSRGPLGAGAVALASLRGRPATRAAS